MNVALNFWMIPKWGMVGAAISTLVAYVVLFVGMAIYGHSVYPVHYQWRRVATALVAGAVLTVAARAGGLSLAPSIVVALSYPLVLLCLGFYHPAELARLRRLAPGW